MKRVKGGGANTEFGTLLRLCEYCISPSVNIVIAVALTKQHYFSKYTNSETVV